VFIVDNGDAPPPPFIMDGRHPERPPQRAAQPISSADSGERSVVARRSWAAPGLSSGRFASAAAAITITLYKAEFGNTPSINRMSVFEAPICFICIGYDWEPSPPSGEAEK
jgi:hypothetical protein